MPPGSVDRRPRGRARRQLRADQARRGRRSPGRDDPGPVRIRRRSCRTTPARCTRRTSRRSSRTCSARTARSKPALPINPEDEITRETLLTRGGRSRPRASSRAASTVMWVLKTPTKQTRRSRSASCPGSIKTIGRSSGAEFIVDAALVSRLHCRLTAGASELEVVDLESTNGTFVNGQRVTACQPEGRRPAGRRPRRADRHRGVAGPRTTREPDKNEAVTARHQERVRPLLHADCRALAVARNRRPCRPGT